MPSPLGGRCDCSWELVTSLLLRIIGAASGSSRDQQKCEPSAKCGGGLAWKGGIRNSAPSRLIQQNRLLRETPCASSGLHPRAETLPGKTHTPVKEYPSCGYNPTEKHSSVDKVARREISNMQTCTHVSTSQIQSTALLKFHSI